MYMNKQTSEMLKILLNSPGQYFTCEALAEYLHVSTRTIRNYMTTIRDFMNQNGKEALLQQSEGGICVTGTAEELWMLSRASVDHEFYLYRLAPTERFVMILITLLMSDTYCTLNDLAEKFKVSRGTILKDMEKVRRYLERQGISFGSLMNKGYSLDIHENERRSLLVRLVQGTLESAYMGEEQENIYWKYLRDEYGLEIYRREVRMLLLEEERNQKLNVSDSCFEEVQFTIVISLARMKHGHLVDRMDKEQPFTGMYPVFEMAERLWSRMHAIFHFPYTEQEELFLAHALYECRFYKDGAADRARDMQMHVAVTDEETASPEYESAYADYKKTYGGMYDTLDMRKVLEQKEKKSGYEPQGAWGMWIVRNYDRLQKRVEQIRKTGEGTYAFYPGSWYKLHSTLYGKLWKKLILQTAVLMILSMLYLMDYERIYKTQDLVLATTTGKKMMEKKMLAGTLCGLFYAGLLTVFTLLVFFAAVPFQNLWHVPVAACMVAEPRLQMMYPFVTFWRLEQWRYLLLALVVLVGLLGIVAAVTAAVQLFLQNSYFSFAVLGLLFMGAYLLAYVQMGNVWDLIREFFNPTVLYATSGGWFMENDLCLSFAGNEFAVLFCSGTAAVCLMAVGKRRYHRLEV